MKRKLLLSGIAILVSAFIATFTNLVAKEAFLNTIYTVSGIMFSIGMGVVCTFNPERIKNNTFLKEIRSNIINIRSSYIYIFTFTSLLYLLNQLFPNYRYSFIIKTFQINIDLPLAFVALNVFGVIYYILNFLKVQELNFDITDRINSNQ